MLNTVLYTRLRALFGEVRVANDNMELVLVPRKSATGDMYYKKEGSGEQYRVCCPFCGDRRFRLYISYAWGMDKDKKYPTSSLVICHNERCDKNCDTSDMSFRRNPVRYLRHHLSNYVTMAESGAIMVRVTQAENTCEPIEPLPFPEPEWTTPVSELSSDHPASMYLSYDRKFDPKTIYEKYGVVFAHKYPVKRMTKDYSFLAGRLFIPAGDGWQARSLLPTTKLKYFTCPGWRKNTAVYNIDNARRYRTRFVVIFEGVTDVWRLNGPSVCTFGKSVSVDQVKLIAEQWDTAVLVYDQDAHKGKSAVELRRTINLISRSIPHVSNVQLPGTKDPGDCTTDNLWSYIEKKATTDSYDYVKRV